MIIQYTDDLWTIHYLCGCGEGNLSKSEIFFSGKDLLVEFWNEFIPMNGFNNILHSYIFTLRISF